MQDRSNRAFPRHRPLARDRAIPQGPRLTAPVSPFESTSLRLKQYAQTIFGWFVLMSVAKNLFGE